jgi:hypothetical protein
MMREIDAKFAKEGMPITARPIRAIGVISGRYRVAMPITDPLPGSPPELLRYAPLSRSVHNWFKQAYGDRLKVDFSAGRVVVIIEEDLYVLHLPRIYGQVKFALSRHFSEPSEISSSGPATCNMLQLVQDLTPAKAASLSDTTLRAIAGIFEISLPAHYALEANQSLELIRIARGDISTAVDLLMDRDQRYGESKWASLQAAEKIMKAAIEQTGRTYKSKQVFDANNAKGRK